MGNFDITHDLDTICEKYGLEGEVIKLIKISSGHINDTYHVVLKKKNEGFYDVTIQRINDYVFKNPDKVMENIAFIDEFLKDHVFEEGECRIQTFLNNLDGENFVHFSKSFWRVANFTPGSTYDTVTDVAVLRAAGFAFGNFQNLLNGFPMEKLNETIPNFHNTKKRLDDYFEAVKQDVCGRAAEVKEDTEFLRKNYVLACTLVNLLDEGELPLRVTHNDTKYNNIVIDDETHKPNCVIDLDTVMPGLIMYDFGDAIRFAANTAEEDERDLEKVGINMYYYEEFTRGFLAACKKLLTPNEIEYLALGAVLMTIELVARFLMDYVQGDKYFKIDRPKHNLERGRCQRRLAEDMLDRYEEMQRIVKKYALDL